MTLSVVGAGGGVSQTPPGTELGYAQRNHVYAPADVTDLTPVPGLSISLITPRGVTFCIEAYLPQIAQASGTPLGDLMYTAITLDDFVVQENYSYTNPTTGDGTAVYLRTPTFRGADTLDTCAVAIENLTAGTHGASITAGNQGPAFIRVLVV